MTTTTRHCAFFEGRDAHAMHALILKAMTPDQRLWLDPKPDGSYVEVIRRLGFWRVSFGKKWPDDDRGRNLDGRRYEKLADALQAIFARQHNAGGTP